MQSRSERFHCAGCDDRSKRKDTKTMYRSILAQRFMMMSFLGLLVC